MQVFLAADWRASRRLLQKSTALLQAIQPMYPIYSSLDCIYFVMSQPLFRFTFGFPYRTFPPFITISYASSPFCQPVEKSREIPLFFCLFSLDIHS
ncbi:hypothetical protein GFV16_19415 [Bacillus megaterium]|nr:hypothetical protein [Priestia megaterium]